MQTDNLESEASTSSTKYEAGEFNVTCLERIANVSPGPGPMLPEPVLSSASWDDEKSSLVHLVSSGVCEAIEAIVAMSHRLDVKEEQLRNADWALEEKMRHQDEDNEDAISALMYQMETLRRFASHMGALEGIAFGVSMSPIKPHSSY